MRSQYYPDKTLLSVLASACLMAYGAQLAAQTPPPAVGTVNPRAIGKPVLQPPPIGGLRTTPLGKTPPVAPRAGKLPFHGIVPLRVIDAPLVRGGAIYQGSSGTDMDANRGCTPLANRFACAPRRCVA